MRGDQSANRIVVCSDRVHFLQVLDIPDLQRSRRVPVRGRGQPPVLQPFPFASEGRKSHISNTRQDRALGQSGVIPLPQLSAPASCSPCRSSEREVQPAGTPKSSPWGHWLKAADKAHMGYQSDTTGS